MVKAPLREPATVAGEAPTRRFRVARAGLLGLVLMLPHRALGSDSDPSDAVRAALGKGSYPWYDAKDDTIKPVTPPAPMPESSGNLNVPDFRSTLVFVLMTLALAVVLALLAWAWSRWRPELELPSFKSRAPGAAVRTASLPTALQQVDSSDPWGEAQRLRAQGDYARAILFLFLHQLLTLIRLGLTRPAPGRTARQLVRAVSDVEIRRRVEPTLRLFEAVFYGHQIPSAAAFEAAWSEAEALERQIGAGVAS